MGSVEDRSMLDLDDECLDSPGTEALKTQIPFSGVGLLSKLTGYNTLGRAFGLCDRAIGFLHWTFSWWSSKCYVWECNRNDYFDTCFLFLGVRSFVVGLHIIERNKFLTRPQPSSFQEIC